MKAKDIARELGLSTATVSLAINNRPGVNEKTRERVMKFLNESQGKEEEWKKKKEKTIRMYAIMEERTYWDAAEHIRLYSSYEEASIKARKAGYKMDLICVYPKDNIEQMLKECEKENVAGVYLSATYMKEEDYACFRNFNLPFIVSDHNFHDERTDSVVLNNEQGVFLGLNHLYDNGHRDILYFRNSNSFYNMYKRREAYLSFMKQKGIPIDEREGIIDIGGHTQAVYEGMIQYIKDKKHIPTAIFAENYEVTIGIARAFESCGYEIPKDISIVGFDEVPSTALLKFEPTCIQAFHSQKANITVGRLLERIKKKREESIDILVNNQLLLGNSVANRNK